MAITAKYPSRSLPSNQTSSTPPSSLTKTSLTGCSTYHTLSLAPRLDSSYAMNVSSSLAPITSPLITHSPFVFITNKPKPLNSDIRNSPGLLYWLTSIENQ